MPHEEPDARSIHELAAVADERPAEVAARTEELVAGLSQDSEDVRLAATYALGQVAYERPAAVRSAVPALVDRLTDTHKIRTNAATALAHVALGCPDEVADHVDALCDLFDDDHPVARGAAGRAVAAVAVGRPGGFSDPLSLVYDLGELRNDAEIPDDDRQAIQEGIDALETVLQPQQGSDGDPPGSTTAESGPESSPEIDTEPDTAPDGRPTPSHGRVTEATEEQPSDADLAPIPDDAPSLPVRILVHAVFWPVYTLSVFPFQFAWRFAKVGHIATQTTPAYALRRFGGTVVFRALTGWGRFVLYLRRFWLLTPGTIVPHMPGSRIPRARPEVDTPAFPDNWDEIRQHVYERDGYQCRNCGAAGGPKGDTELHIDHRTPRSAGGEDHPRNLRTLCRPCHEIRHRRTFD